MDFARDPSLLGLGRHATQAYRSLLLANERRRVSGDRRDPARKRRRRRPFLVLALDPDDHLVLDALALSAGAALVLRPQEMISEHGVHAFLAYADLLEVPLLADFTSEGVASVVDLAPYGFDVVRMAFDPASAEIYPVLDLTAAA